MADDGGRYAYRIYWSDDDGGYVASVAEFPDLRYAARSSVAALTGLHVLVRERVAALEAAGEEVPKPFGEREYSGRFVVRVPPELHRRLVIEAAEQGVSLNRLVQTRLASER